VNLNAWSEGVRSIFRQSFGINPEMALDFILRDCRKIGGFAGQAPLSSLSRSSTATIIYALSLARCLDPISAANFLALLRRFRTHDGPIDHVAGLPARRNWHSTWTTALVGAASIACGEKVENLFTLAEWLGRTQENGMWAFMPGRGKPNWLYTFYCVLFLRQFRSFGEDFQEVLNRTVAKGHAQWIGLSLTEKLLARRCLKLAGSVVSQKREQQLASELNSLRSLDLLSFNWHERTEPLFYVYFFPAAAFLLVDDLLSVECRFSQLIFDRLRRDLVGTGWCDGNSGEPLCWATALGFATAVRWCERAELADINVALMASHASSREQRRYNVAISFSGKNRQVARQIYRSLTKRNLSVFYDEAEQHVLLGTHLPETLQAVYRDQSDYVVIIGSQAYIESTYAFQVEWKAILERAVEKRGAYILPYMLEDVLIPGLSTRLGYISVESLKPTAFADLVYRKWRAEYFGNDIST
jgi:hypothetical protein